MRYDRKVSACVNRETKSQMGCVCDALEISESKFVRTAIQAYLRTAYHITIVEPGTEKQECQLGVTK